MSDERIRRPELDRTEPVRDWSTMFNASRANGPSKVDANPDAAESSKRGRGPERDVAMGYRVIDEYMRLGAAAAGKLAQGNFDPNTANQMFDRLLEAASDLGSVWVEMLQALWSTQASQRAQPADPGAFELRDAPPETPRSAAEASAAFSSAPPIAVAFRIQGGRDVEVSAELTARPDGRAWLVHDLRAKDSAVPRIADVVFEYDALLGRAAIVITIPAEQPAGVYSGLIVDDQTNLPRGSVSLRLL